MAPSIRVSVTPDRAARRIKVDFTGTSAQLPGNFNAPLAITRAAVLYVFRTLVDDAIPAQRRMPEADRDHRAGRLAAEPETAARRWWRAMSRRAR